MMRDALVVRMMVDALTIGRVVKVLMMMMMTMMMVMDV